MVAAEVVILTELLAAPASLIGAMRLMASYFFPILSLIPKFDVSTLDCGEFRVHRRLRSTSIFDLATLSTRHSLHLPYQLMDLYLSGCNLEVEILGSSDHEEALNLVQIIRSLLYLRGVFPFVIPFVTTHSINQYSGINSRDSELLRLKLPESERTGLTSETGNVEAWPADLTLQVISFTGIRETPAQMWTDVGGELPLWKTLESQFHVLNLARRLLNSAPMIPDLGASILGIWQGIESLFPSVTTEVSFRLALLVSQLCAPLRNPGETFRETKKKYGVRSKIAHGSCPKSNADDWTGAWVSLCACLRGVVERKKLPTEEELLSELLPS